MKLTNLILSNDQGIMSRILVLSGIAWIPLVILTAIDGTLFNNDITIPFIKDVTPFVRCLIVIPLLVMADNVIEPMMARVMTYIQTSGLIPNEDEDKHLQDTAEKMASTMNNKWILLTLLILAVLFSLYMRSDYIDMLTERGATSWMLRAEDGAVSGTFAGTWFLLVSSPLVSFLLYRWIWRFINWTVLLKRISKMKLALCASHTDLAGGLGVIGANHVLFGIIFFILAVLFASNLADNMLYEEEVLHNAKQMAIIFIVISIAILLTPLMFFTRQLVELKHTALIEYSKLQNQISIDFHKQWIKENADDLVDSMQPSAMADYSAVFENVSNMRLLPIDHKTVIYMAAILVIPFLPLALVEVSLWQFMQNIGDILV